MAYDPVKNGALCSQCPRKLQKPVGPCGPRVGAKVVWLGQDPGKTEVQLGQPFVGATGKRLTSIWQAAEKLLQVSVPRASILITNTCCCLPVTKSPKEAKLAVDCCKPRLVRELKLTHPDAWVLSMGKWAFYALTGRLKGQGKYSGFHLPLEREAYEAGSPASSRKLGADFLEAGGPDGDDADEVVEDADSTGP